MACTDRNIGELLPAYLEQSLDLDGKTLVERHLIGCAHCAEELLVLRELSEDRVPDPGASYWDGLAERVYREVRRQQDAPRTARSRPLPVRAWPRWAAVAAAMAMAASLVLLQPEAPRELPVTAGSSDLSADEAPTSLADLLPSDFEQLGDWADREIARLGGSLRSGIITADGSHSTLEEFLADLTDEELARLEATLARKGEV